MTTKKLTPESPRWDEFVNALEAALDTWGCDGDAEPNVHHHAKRIMAEMGDIDIPASLASIKNAVGYCDCEIFLNVDPGFLGRLGEISVICDFRAVCSRVRTKVSPAARDRGAPNRLSEKVSAKSAGGLSTL